MTFNTSASFIIFLICLYSISANLLFFWVMIINKRFSSCFQLASGLQSWVEDHSNITMFNFVAYPIFKNTMILTPNTPPLQKKKTIKGKNSLSPSHLKEHNCLSLIQLQKWKKKKLEELSRFKMKRKEKLCIPPMNMFWYCSKWKYKHLPLLPPPPTSKCPHTVWVKVFTWQWSNSL